MDVANERCRDQVRENVLLKQYYCDVDVGHLISFNEELAHRLVTEPAEIIPLVCDLKTLKNMH
jgi:DNA replicative helicase MCM subunit Mcm2 (Cdc46/Mcm family)